MSSTNIFVPGQPVEDRSNEPKLQLPPTVGLDRFPLSVPRKATRWAVIGASRENRWFYSRGINAGQLTRKGGWVYGTTADQHELHTGARCYLSMQPSAGQPIDQQFRGHFTFIRTGASTFKAWIPRAADGTEYPDGTSTVSAEIISLDHVAPTSIAGWLNMQPSIRGALRIVGASCTGGTNTVENRARFAEVLSENPDGVILVGGIGNDRLSGFTEATTQKNIDWMLNECFKRGIVVIQSPGSMPTNAVTVSDITIGARLFQRYKRLASKRQDHLILDEITPCVDPTTGYSKANLLADDLHQQPEGAKVIAEANAANLVRVLEVRDYLPLSILDRYAANAGNPNIYDGGWSATGVDASTLNSKATGTADAAVLITTSGNASRAVVCSLVADNGAYTSRFAMTGVAAADTFIYDFAGTSGALMSSRLKPDTEYEVVCQMSLTASGAGVIRAFELKAEATLSYDEFTNVNGTLAACFTYQGDTAKNNVPLHVLRSNTGTLYPVFRFRTPKITAASAFGIRFRVVFQTAGTAALDVTRLAVTEVLE